MIKNSLCEKMALCSKINRFQNLPAGEKNVFNEFLYIDTIKLGRKNSKDSHILPKTAFCRHFKNCNFTRGDLSIFFADLDVI